MNSSDDDNHVSKAVDTELDPSEYKDTPHDQWKRWNAEITAAQKDFRTFHKEGKRCVKKYLDTRNQEQDEWGELTTRLNLFHANVQTLTSMLYGKMPRVEVARRFADADDDVARVAGLMLTRILNTDIEEAGEDAASVFRNCLQDRLIPGLGTARVQYQFSTKKEQFEAIVQPDTGEEIAPAVEIEHLDTEWVDIVYTHWGDVLWSTSRTHPEIRWKAYRSWLDKQEFEERFPEIDIKKISFSNKTPIMRNRGERQDLAIQPQVEVWEIWEMRTKTVFWWTYGYEYILDEMDDPLELKGFWPEPPPFIANVTTSKFLPRSDYTISQDLYREIDKLQTRISLLTDAAKVVGLYDKSNDGIKRIFTEGVENDLIPVDNWAMFAEKGGLKGTIDWVPLDAVINAISVLTEKQTEKIQQLYQVTGMNDVMRGAALSSSKTSATRDQLEASYGSIRVEALQNEFARWVGDLQGLKVEIISRFYSQETIVKQSNIMSTADATTNPQLIDQAVALIQDCDNARWRITVRPETLAIADYAQLKQDRTEYINALALFMQSSAPLLEMDPGSLPSLLKLLKWGLSGFRGSSEIEGVIDADIARLEKQPPQQKPNPQMQAQQAQAQADQQKIQLEMKQSQQDHSQKMQQSAQEHQSKMQQTQAKFQLEMQAMMMEFKTELTKIMTEMVATQRANTTSTQLQALGDQHGAVLDAADRQHEAAVDAADREHAAQVQMESRNSEAGGGNGSA